MSKEALANEALNKMADNARELGLDYEPAQQEPVACVQDLDEVKRKHLVYEKGMEWKDPLYASPPAQRKPLTDEEIDSLFFAARTEGGFTTKETFTFFARAIEAAHGIKENT